MSPRRGVVALLLCAAIAGACSKEDSDTGPGNGPAIALSLSATSASVAQGSSTTVTGTITRSGGFAGDILLTVEGAPMGVTEDVSNITTAAGVTTATITIQVSAAVAIGSYTITARGTGTGVSSVTATFNLTVVEGGSYTMAAMPAALSLAAGSSGQVSLTFVFMNINAGVALSLEGAPAGVTGTFTPTSLATGPTTLTISVGASVTPGTYALTVRGRIAGFNDVTAVVRLTVLAESYNITLTPAALSIVQGASATSTVTLNRTNFADGVSLTLEGTPAGVTGAFSPNPASAAVAGGPSSAADATTSTVSTLTVSVSTAVTPGIYALKVRGKNPALADVTADLSLTVATGVIANGKIAFKSGLDAIWTVNPDGTALTQLTPGYSPGSACAAGDEEPRWSPDGTKLVFTRTKDGSQDIWVMNADGTNQTRLTNDGDGKCSDTGPNNTWSENPSWSPDGKRIIFTSARASTNFNESLWTMNADGTGQKLLLATATSHVSEASYSPDGTTIAFHVEPIATSPALRCDGDALGGEIWSMNADGTNQKRLTTTSNCSFDENPVWSPDGRRIAFTRCPQAVANTDCANEIFIMNADGTNRVQLTSNFAGFSSEHPAFSPDGTRIVFANGVNGSTIWHMNLDGSNKVPVSTGSLVDNGEPAWQTVFRPAVRR